MRTKKPEQTGKYLSAKDAAKFLAISERHLRQLKQDGDGPPFIPVGLRRIAYDRDDLIKWMESRKQRPGTDEDGGDKGNDQ